jgi:hypothetical protein
MKMRKSKLAPVPREWLKLSFVPATEVLINLRQIAQSGVLDGLPYQIAALRRRDLKRMLEARQAALFCYGIGRALGTEVRFALHESADYDVVACYQTAETTVFVPVQLKELVPAKVNPHAELQDILDKLDRTLCASTDLVVAIHINRDITGLRPASLRLPRNIGQLWLFGAKDSTQSSWFLIGDMLTDSTMVREFIHPMPRSLYWLHTSSGPFAQRT